MDVPLNGKEEVVAASIVPVLGWVPMAPIPARHQLIGLAGARERRMVVGADEHDGGAGSLGSV